MDNFGLSMNYDEIEEQCRALDTVVENFNESRNQMTTAVGVLCDGWKSKTSDSTRENYSAMSEHLTKTVEIVEELKAEIRKYVQDIMAIDSSYAGTTVQ